MSSTARRQKTAKPNENSRDDSITASARIAIAELESRACRDLTLARLTLGLFNAISYFDSAVLFPGYKWHLHDVNAFPAPLKSHVRNLVKLGQGQVTWLKNLLDSQAVIEGAVHKIRWSSPAGKRWRKIAARIREQNPVRDTEYERQPSDRPPLSSIGILPDLIGQPLTDRTIRVIEGFKPSVIEVLSDRESSTLQWAPGSVRIQLRPDGYSVQSIDFLITVARSTLQPREIHGELQDYFETGTEGVLWSLNDDENFGYDALKIIQEGDHLTILDSLGKEIWSGTIQCDHKSGYRSYPMNPKHGQPCALGYWIHWTQKGFKPDDWARFFVRPGFDRLRGILVRKSDWLPAKPEPKPTTHQTPRDN